MYTKIFNMKLGLLSTILLLTPLCTISEGSEGCPPCIENLVMKESACPAPEDVLCTFYKNPKCGSVSPFATENAELSYRRIQGITQCLDKTTGENNWCGCFGFACLSGKVKNDRLSVQLLPGPDHTGVCSAETWRITSNKPFTITTDSKISSCNTGSNYRFSSMGGTTTLEFEMPAPGTVIPNTQVCMWELHIGSETYHEHFGTDYSCLGWVEIKLTK